MGGCHIQDRIRLVIIADTVPRNALLPTARNYEQTAAETTLRIHDSEPISNGQEQIEDSLFQS
jgi:hypothetical protein